MFVPPDPELPECEIAEAPLQIPHTALSADALTGVIESFVLREGTDYGVHEFPLPQKIAQVRSQLERGEAQIWYDPGTRSVEIRRAGKP